jgi:predicted N-acetyltransferase YhbS
LKTLKKKSNVWKCMKNRSKFNAMETIHTSGTRPMTRQLNVSSPKPEEFSKLYAFLNEILRPSHTTKVQDEYPVALHESNRARMCIARNQDQIVSHAAYYPMDITIPDSGIPLRIAAITSVATHPDFRGQGLSTRCLHQCLTNAQEEECLFAVLWSDQHAFYRKMGFILCGEDYWASLNEDKFGITMPRHPEKDIRKYQPQWLEQMHGLYKSHVIHSGRSESEFGQFLKIPDTLTYLLCEKDDVLAYMSIGKGADLKGCIHEWAGDRKNLAILLRRILRRHFPLQLMAPSEDLDFVQDLLDIGYEGKQNRLALIKALDFPRFFEIVSATRGAALGLSIEYSFSGGNHKLLIDSDEYKTEDETALTQLAFGPEKPTELLKIGGRIGIKLDALLPVPFYMWGFDSI